MPSSAVHQYRNDNIKVLNEMMLKVDDDLDYKLHKVRVHQIASMTLYIITTTHRDVDGFELKIKRTRQIDLNWYIVWIMSLIKAQQKVQRNMLK